MRPGGQGHRAFTVVELGIVMAMIAILAAILFPVFAQSRKAARKSQCQEHLYQIGLALQLYARDYDSRFPPVHNDLRPLARNYLSDLDMLECSSDAAAPDIRRANAVGTRVDRAYASYQYRGGLTSEDRPGLGLVGDWALLHDGGANVLCLDGRVKWYRTPNLPRVSFGPRVLPPGVTAPSTDPPTPYLNDPPSKPDPANSALGGSGE